MSYRRHALPESEDILLLNDVRHRAQHSIFWRSIKKSGKLIGNYLKNKRSKFLSWNLWGKNQKELHFKLIKLIIKNSSLNWVKDVILKSVINFEEKN